MRAWWYMAQVHAERLGMSDHSWVHTQIVLNIGLRVLRLLVKAGVEPTVVADHGMKDRDAEVVVAGGALLHDVGMSIHRADHEEYSLFLAQLGAAAAARRQLPRARAHGRHRGDPARDHRPPPPRRALHGRGRRGPRRRRPRHGRRAGSGSRSRPAARGSTRSRAAAVDEVRIEAGEERPVRIEIDLNNSAGIFQVDDLLATKIRDTPLEGRVEVVAKIEGESEKRLLSGFRLD